MPDPVDRFPESAELAFATIQQVNEAIKLRGVDLSEDEALTLLATTRTLSFHGNHLKCHGVEQKTLDVYKIATWYGFSLIQALVEREDCEGGEGHATLNAIISGLVATLAGFLNLDSGGKVILPRNTVQFLRQLILEEALGNEPHGIGRNGLYAAFHCCIATLRCLKNPEGNIENI